MEDIRTIIKLVADFGIMLVIVGIFLYVVIKLINIWLSKYEKSVETKKHDELINVRATVGNNIQQIIQEYLVHSGGNRIHVIEFSNSVVSVAYLPFRYMTCTYEVYALGKSATGHKIDRISTSLFTPFFEALQSSPYCIFDINDKKTIVGGAMCDLMKSQNEHQALCKLMKSEKGKAIGYVELIKDGEITEADITGMETASNKLSALLSIVDK